MYKRCLILLPVLLLAACGFHLRGSQSAPAVSISSVYLQSQGAEGVAAEIRKQLKQTDTTLAANAGEADYVLNLSDQRTRSTVLSVSATTGKVNKYKMFLSVLVSISRGETPLVTRETVQVTRDYAFDPGAVLAKTAEERLLQEDMVRSAASQIILRLNALSRD